MKVGQGQKETNVFPDRLTQKSKKEELHREGFFLIKNKHVDTSVLLLF